MEGHIFVACLHLTRHPWTSGSLGIYGINKFEWKKSLWLQNDLSVLTAPGCMSLGLVADEVFERWNSFERVSRSNVNRMLVVCVIFVLGNGTLCHGKAVIWSSHLHYPRWASSSGLSITSSLPRLRCFLYFTNLISATNKMNIQDFSHTIQVWARKMVRMTRKYQE